MKLFQSLVRQLKETHSQPVRQLNQYIQKMRRGTKLAAPPASLPPCSQSIKTVQPLFHRASHSPLVLILVVVSLTSALGYRFYNAPKLDIGKASTQTIYAPDGATVEDSKATEENRKIARTGSLPVLKLDRVATEQAQRQLQQQLGQSQAVRDLAGAFPYVKTAFLTVKAQGILREATETEWRSIVTAVDAGFDTKTALAGSNVADPNPATVISDAEEKQAIAELRAYRRSVELGNFLLVIRDISDARFRYAAAIGTVSQPILPNLPKHFDLDVLNLSDSEWNQLRKDVPQIADRVLAQGISPGLPDSVLHSAVERHLNGMSRSTSELSKQLLFSALKPNLIRDEEQTTQRAEKAAQEIPSVMVSTARGALIVRQGDIITSGDFALLEHFKLSRRGIDWQGLCGFGALVCGSVAIVWVVQRRYNKRLRRRDGVLIWLLSLSTPLLVTLPILSTNLPAVGLLVGSFYGAPLGITVTGLLTILLAAGMNLNVSYLLSSAVGGVLCGWLGGRLRSREELAVLGLGVGVLQGTLYLLLNVASGTVWYTLLGASVMQGLIGLAWVIVGMGSSPYLEQLFDLVTTIRLVELANPNRPLLKRLAAEAPGTFQHTLFVATLAEAAARSLGCNVELVRAGTLYHDIGKMHDPLGFIENQMGGPNKHDEMNNPWKSADIIKKHVSEGIAMARRARLPKAIQAFIPEHQGTMLIAFFYHQAQQQATDSQIEINEADFRYDGPIPQSRETGIVMLADSCEAALRSLKDATPEEALTMINKILRARWQDNQLVHSGLTRAEMTQIAEVFVQVWQQFNHKRIAYPKLSPVARSLVK